MERKLLTEISNVEQLVATSGFTDAFATADPYSSGFPAATSVLFSLAGEKLHREIVSSSPGYDSLTAYRNVIAISMGSPFLLSAISRATLSANSDEVKALHELLSNTLRKAAKSDPGLCWLYDPSNEGKSTIPASIYFTPSLRLRYSLAATSRQRIRAESWVKSVRTHPGCSRLTAQRELRRALREAEKWGARITRISVAAFYAMPIAEQMLVTSDRFLSKAFISTRANIREITADVAKSWKVRTEARRKLRQLCNLIADRQFRKAESVSSSFSVGAIDGHLKEEFSLQLLARFDAPNKSALDVKWHPMGPELRRVLYILTGKRFSSSILSLSVEEGVLKASKNRLYPKGISKIDLARLKKRLTPLNLALLASGGRFDLAGDIPQRVVLPYLEQLSDSYHSQDAARGLLETLVADSSKKCIKQALPLLQGKEVSALRLCIRSCFERPGWSVEVKNSKEMWRKCLLPYIGTRAAEGILKPDSKTILGALKIARSKKSPSNSKAFHQQLFSWLYELLLNKSTLKEGLEFSKAYQKINPDFARSLANRLGVENVSRLILAVGLNDRFVSLLEGYFQDQKDQRQLMLVRLKLSGKPDGVLAEVRRDSEFVGMLTPELLKSIASGSGAERRALHILCLRRSPKKLQVYLGTFHWRVSKISLLSAARLLKLTSRDRGYLELVAALGPVYVRTTAAVLARISSRKPVGHKLDDDYKTYKLPKKSGGNRTISVPSPVLKRVQRGILYSILNPLGSHAASYGFVKGRSIRDNAQRHVGQEVVVNCDVSNCFPSVTWSLVLGVVRRDLGEYLSPAAISLIVDICTGHGGLPIGAPTSPLLLNRVLLRTDEIMTRASIDRGCIYSRYADDLTFSGDGRAVELLGVAKGTLTRIGLELDSKKTNIFRRGRRQVVNGLSVNECVNVPRRIRRRLRSALHYAEQGSDMHWHGKEMNMSSLQGRISFVDSINSEAAKSMIRRFKRIEQ